MSESSSESVRLNRFLASAGLGSRRKCEEYILEGRVSVNGEDVFDLSVTIDPRKDEVRLDDERIRPKRKLYYLINKPVGYLCTHRDPDGRPRAVDLVPNPEQSGLFTVGRLDESSEGLLLVTNDGELANRLAHPRFQVARTYRVQVAGVPQKETLNELLSGFHFREGKFWLNRAKRLRVQKNSSFLEVDLRQGRNREIRRLFARVGHKVLSLTRIGFGPLRLGDLPTGAYRLLSTDEIRELKRFAKSAPGSPGRSRSRGPGGSRRGSTTKKNQQENTSGQRSRRGASRFEKPRSKSSSSKPSTRKPAARKSPPKKRRKRP